MKKQHLQLSEDDRQALQTMLSKGQLAVNQFKRATGLLALDQGESYQAVATLLQANCTTVRLWRDRFVAEGMASLKDKPRPGRPVRIDGQQRGAVTALACSDPPTGYGQWTMRLLANKAVELEYCDAISHTQVANILKKTK